VSSNQKPDRTRRPPLQQTLDTQGAAGQPAEHTARGASAAAPLPDTASNVPPELAALQGYEIVKELGRGGMGVVYLARNRLMGRLEVLKVMNKALVGQPAAVDRFLQEIQSAARLNHPNVVTAHSAHQVGDLLVLAMEFVEGQDLAKVVRDRGPLPVAYACYCVHQATVALQRGHELELVHRDIKPSNLLLANQGKRSIVKVIDFGLAKAKSEVTHDQELTPMNAMMGTPGYCAPEQVLDAKSADERSDIYSLGCTLYYLLAGHPPFRGGTIGAVIVAQQAGAIRPLREVRPAVPEELAAVVARMMAADPKDRYQETSEVAAAIVPFIKQVPRGSPSSSEESVSNVSSSRRPTAASPTVTTAVSPVSEPSPSPFIGSPGAPAIETATSGLRDESVSKGQHGTAGITSKSALAALTLTTILFGIVALIVGGMIIAKSPGGTLVVYVNSPNANVFVDGEKQKVTWEDGGRKGEIRVKAGTHDVEVKMDGFASFKEKVSLRICA
jgi:serine/threonine protein kinase